jgi:hypothetical protein
MGCRTEDFEMRTPEQKVKHAAYMRAYYRKTREKWLARVKIYRDANIEAIAARKAAYSVKPEAKEDKKTYNQNYYSKKREEILAQKRGYYGKNKSDILKRNAEYYKKNRLSVDAKKMEWVRAHPEKRCFYKTKRRTAKLNAIPAWADFDAIEKVYEKAESFCFDVDHVVPLLSPLVCGLHTWENLQLLHPSDNRSKGNRIWPDMP